MKSVQKICKYRMANRRPSPAKTRLLAVDSVPIGSAEAAAAVERVRQQMSETLPLSKRKGLAHMHPWKSAKAVRSAA